MNSIAMRPGSRSSITAWPTPDQKAGFAALAASRGLSESRLLGLLIDSVLERNAVDEAGASTMARRGRAIALPCGCVPAMASCFGCGRSGVA